MSGQGALRRRGAHWWPPHIPSPPPHSLLHPVSMSCQPFCEHVLQHSCCSTFLWQRLFFLTSTQKLPSAQDSSFAFHRPGRRNTGGRLEEGEGRKTHAHKHRHMWKHTYTQGRTIRNGWMAGTATWLVRRGFRRQEEFFWSNHRWCSSRWKMIVVQGSDWFHVRRDGKQI